jgi:hypothetical protein
MNNVCCWKQNAGWIAWMLLLSGVLLMAVGCDSGADPAVEQVQFPESGGELILTEDEPASGGAMKVTLEIAPPDDIVSPDNPVGGPLTSKAEADIHFEAQIRYTGAVLGGRNKGDFVPYLDVELTLTNRDSGKKSEKWRLVPHVGIAEGYHYGRNIALVETLGASEAGYDADVTINSPVPFGDASTSAISPGIVMHSDISDNQNIAGTLLGPAPVVISAGFILGDFKTITSEEMREEASTESEPADDVYMY